MLLTSYGLPMPYCVILGFMAKKTYQESFEQKKALIDKQEAVRAAKEENEKGKALLKLMKKKG